MKAFLGSYIKLPGLNSLMAITGRLLNNDISFRGIREGTYFLRREGERESNTIPIERAAEMEAP